MDISKEIPSGLSELYGHITEYCENVLVAACLAYRPLSISELAVVAALPSNIDPHNVVEKCGSFLTTREETVYIIY